MAKDGKPGEGKLNPLPLTDLDRRRDDMPEALAHRRQIEELEARNRSYRTLARLFLYGVLVIAIVTLVLQATSSVIDTGIGNPWDLIAGNRAKPKDFQQTEDAVSSPPAPSNLRNQPNAARNQQARSENEQPAVVPEPAVHPSLHLAKTWDAMPACQVFSPDGSRAVRIEYDKSVLECLDLTTNPVTSFEMDMKTPLGGAVFKRFEGKTWLVVAAPSNDFTELHLIDADDLRLYKSGLGKGPVKIAGRVGRLFASKGDDPWIYLVTHAGLSRFHVSKHTQMPFRAGSFETMFVSDSGDQIWIQQHAKGPHFRLDWPRESDDPSEVKRRDATVPALSILRGVSEITSPDSRARNTVVAFERELWDGSLSNRIVATSFDTQFVFPNSGWIVGVDEQGFAFADPNDGRTVTQVPLPSNWFQKTYTSSGISLASSLASARASSTATATSFYDEKRQRLWFAWSRHLIRLDLSKIELPSVSSIWPSNIVPTDWTAGVGQQVDLGIADRTVKCEIVHGPEGMTIADQAIEWTPTMAQVGEHTFELVISRGSSEHVRKVTVAVDRPSLELPWKVYGLTTNDSGTFAIGIGKSVAIHNRSRRFQQLLVVDLREQRVVLDQTLPDPVVCIDLTEDSAFLGLYGRVMKASLPDLKAVDQVSDTTWNQHDVEGLVAIGNDELWASVSNRWIPIDQATFDFAPAVQTGGARVFGRLEEGWLRDGVLYDVADKKPKFLLWPAEVRYTALPGDIFRIRVSHRIFRFVFRQRVRLQRTHPKFR